MIVLMQGGGAAMSRLTQARGLKQLLLQKRFHQLRRASRRRVDLYICVGCATVKIRCRASRRRVD